MTFFRLLFVIIALLGAFPLAAQETQTTSAATEAGGPPAPGAETRSMSETSPSVTPTPPGTPRAAAKPAPLSPAPASSGDTWWENNFRIAGDFREEMAIRLASPQNLTKLKGQARIDLKFIFSDHFKLRLGGRAWADGAYDLTGQYPKPVRSNMRKEVLLRDAYLDMTFPYINVRVGHQQIVWGEALGQFFADVVTPKDFREFILQNFEEMRLPIWAIDAQFNPVPDLDLEVVLSPDQQVDKLALQGSDFAFRIPPTPGIETVIQPDHRPSTNFKTWNAGLRASYLVSGWDLAWFYYTSPDHTPALRKTFSFDPLTGTPILSLDPIHRRVHHVATTFSKGFDAFVVRGEFVYTIGRLFNSTTPAAGEGLTQSNLFRYVLGLDYDIQGHVLLNAEFQQEIVARARSRISDDKMRTWFFLHAQSNLFHDKLTPELAFIVGLDGGDTMIRPKLTWNATDMITLSAGADFFTGPKNQLYGEFNGQDRFYLNSQWRF